MWCLLQGVKVQQTNSSSSSTQEPQDGVPLTASAWGAPWSSLPSTSLLEGRSIWSDICQAYSWMLKTGLKALCPFWLEDFLAKPFQGLKNTMRLLRPLEAKLLQVIAMTTFLTTSQCWLVYSSIDQAYFVLIKETKCRKICARQAPCYAVSPYICLQPCSRGGVSKPLKNKYN